MTTAAAFIFGIAFGLFGYAWVSAPERRRTRTRMARLRLRADLAVYTTEVMRAERDTALGLRAAARDDSPIHDRLVLEAMEREFE